MNGRNIELIYGGAASGKSEYAESRAAGAGSPVYYLATMRRGSEVGDIRIKNHVKRREGKGFITMECPTDIEKTADKVRGGIVLLECLTNLAANELFTSDTGSCEDAAYKQPDRVCDKILRDISAVSGGAARLIVVSGDVMRDGESYSEETEAYIELIGRLNSELSAVSDRIYEVVYGCPKRIK